MGIANELITRGWTQGAYVDGDGRVCLVGAMCRSALGDDWLRLAFEEQSALVKHRAAITGALGTHRAIDWNDTPGRTFDEVLRVAKIADEILGAS